MKYSLLLFVAATALVGCNQPNSSSGIDDEGSTEKVGAESNTSYEGLKTLLDSKQPVYGDYLRIDGKPAIEGMVQEHDVQQESDKYIIIRSRDGGTMVSNYYMLSFSKSTGQLISFIGVGQEAEGVDPLTINWDSPTSFTTVDNKYELVEDEESGAYMKGAIIDSVAIYYLVSLEGLISPAE